MATYRRGSRPSRRAFLRGAGAAGLGLLAACAPLPGQAPPSAPRVGVLVHASGSSTYEAFRLGLRDLGYVEGQNIAVEYRSAEGQPARFPALAAELAALPVDMIVAGTIAAAIAAARATTTIPIVVLAGDLIASGLATNLARPGGNVTGPTSLNRQTNGKRLQLLKDASPAITRVAALWNPEGPSAVANRQDTEFAADALGLGLQVIEVRDPTDFESAFNVARERADALLLLGDPVISLHVAHLADLATQNRLPAMYLVREFSEAGGLLSYGPNQTETARRAAGYAAKILQGARAADLPIEQPTTFDFIINLKTAQALGVTIPQHVLLQATEVIQ